MENKTLIDKLKSERELSVEQWVQLISTFDENDRAYAADLAGAVARENFGNKVYIRGIVEFSNFCRNDCYYCGIRRSNKSVSRYRLTKEQILDCCKTGYEYGFRTFVFQSGEDGFYTLDILTDLVRSVKALYPDCAITLSLGEMDKKSYEALYKAGADRYLLRHEAADAELYSRLHPAEMSLQNREQCLYNLKQIGFQTGAGMMLGAPFQTPKSLAEDMMFLKQLQPHMVGTGPFIPHKDTPFKSKSAGSLNQTLFFLSLIRLMMPRVLLPATTALGTIHPQGREMGVRAGANVIMPNLSPMDVRKKYLLYDKKICTGHESAMCIECLNERLKKIDYEIDFSRGDYSPEN